MTRLALVIALAACGARRSAPAPIANEAAPVGAAAPPAAEARVRVRGKAYGVLELSGDREMAMAQARHVMEGHCGHARYVITHEADRVVRYECTKH